MLSLHLTHTRRRAGIAAGIIALVATAACSDDVTAPRPTLAGASASSTIDLSGVPILIKLPPVADGVLKPGEYDGGASFSFPLKLAGDVFGFSSSATAYVKHDNEYLYLAVTFDRKSPFRSGDHVAFEFDIDHDGDAENGDDIVGLHANSSGAWDFYRFDNGKRNQADVADGGWNDATGAFGAVGTKGVFEIRKELNSGDHLHDIGIYTSTGAVRVGLQTMVALEAGRGTYVRTFKPGAMAYCDLLIGQNFTTYECE